MPYRCLLRINVLRKRASWLVRLASNLSYLQGASLSDCGVTAWNALYGLKAVKPGEWVLTQGTGGVSLFAIQVC